MGIAQRLARSLDYLALILQLPFVERDWSGQRMARYIAMLPKRLQRFVFQKIASSSSMQLKRIQPPRRWVNFLDKLPLIIGGEG